MTTAEPAPIPFNRPSLAGREIEYMRAAVEGGQTSADGPFSALASNLLREALGAADVLLTTSCTAALELSALMLDLEPGDTVVVPSFTFVTTALPFALAGAKLLFCDIERETLGLDPDHLATLLDGSVRAVVPVNYAGVACKLDDIARAIEPFPRIDLIEDNAHGLFGRYRGRPLGTFGRFATLSFHETKNFICGEGGALVINDEADIPRAHTLFHKGTNRREFMLGQVDKYSWQDVGSSFGLADVLAAYLHGQLEHRDTILAKRRAVFDRYTELLGPHTARLGFDLPTVPDDCEQAYHMFYVLLPTPTVRNEVLSSMHAAGVHATFHYVPLHSSRGGSWFSARAVECPVTDDVSARILRLPFFTTMTREEVERAADVFVASVETARSSTTAS